MPPHGDSGRNSRVWRPGRISYGVSSYGYDVRVGTRFKIFTPTPITGDIASKTPIAYLTTRAATNVVNAVQMTIAESYINGLEIPEAEKVRLLAMTPGSYVGKAAELAKRA